MERRRQSALADGLGESLLPDEEVALNVLIVVAETHLIDALCSELLHSSIENLTKTTISAINRHERTLVIQWPSR